MGWGGGPDICVPVPSEPTPARSASHRDSTSSFPLRILSITQEVVSRSPLWRVWGGASLKPSDGLLIHPTEPPNMTNCLVRLWKRKRGAFLLHLRPHVRSARADLSFRVRVLHPPERVSEIRLLERSQHPCCHNQAKIRLLVKKNPVWH